MIWRRTVASQMAPAKYLKTSAEFSCDKYSLSASGSKELFDGFRKIWTYSDPDDQYLPVLMVGEKVDLEDTIYDTMRNGHGVEMVDKLGYTAADKSSYRTFIQNWPYGNTAWAQKNFGETFPIISGGRTYNYYATLVKDRQNIDKFIRSLPDLDQRLTQLSSQLKQPIRYKINSMLTALASENDNFKLFYYG